MEKLCIYSSKIVLIVFHRRMEHSLVLFEIYITGWQFKTVFPLEELGTVGAFCLREMARPLFVHCQAV